MDASGQFEALVPRPLDAESVRQRRDLEDIHEDLLLTVLALEAAVAAGARGMRVRFPEIGALAWREVKARKAGKGTNPFTGESIMLKARAASKKPRWSFPKAVREAYSRQATRKAA